MTRIPKKYWTTIKRHNLYARQNTIQNKEKKETEELFETVCRNFPELISATSLNLRTSENTK